MGKLWFHRSNGEEVLVAEHVVGKNISIAMHEYIHKLNPNYKSYYTRCWEENGRVAIDFGSWSEFFYWEGTMNDYFSSGENS